MLLWWIWAFFFRLNWWHKRSCQAWLGKDRRRTWENERAIYCVATYFQSTFDIYLTFVNWMRPDCLCSPNDKRNKGMQAFWENAFEAENGCVLGLILFPVTDRIQTAGIHKTDIQITNFSKPKMSSKLRCHTSYIINNNRPFYFLCILNFY